MNGHIYDSDELYEFVNAKIDEINDYLGKKHNIALVIDTCDDKCHSSWYVLDSDDGKDEVVEMSELRKCVISLCDDIFDMEKEAKSKAELIK